MEDTLLKRLTDIENWLQKEYMGIRTGQATPALLDSLRVENYGTRMPINQVGSVGIEDARTLRISPWDAGSIAAIERAIKDADLGVSVSTDSAGLRVIFPELTSERRVQLLKLAKSKLEDARVSVRSVRDEVMKELDARQKDSEISEDEKFTKKESTQKLVDAANAKLESMYTAKEAEINQ
ncbi:MAG: ribosome recycling factor [Candidatus Paceibacterota bacterium]